VRRRAIEKRGLTFNLIIMKFEKIGDSKFASFKQDEVLNPILITGGWTDTSNPGISHDRFQPSGSMTDYQSTANGSTFTGDGQTLADYSDTNGNT